MVNRTPRPAPLTPKERSEIWDAIYRHMNADDRDPKVVIHERYGGDEEAYLRTMAQYHGLPIGTI